MPKKTVPKSKKTGRFYVVDGSRVHESDLTRAQKQKLADQRKRTEKPSTEEKESDQ